MSGGEPSSIKQLRFVRGRKPAYQHKIIRIYYFVFLLYAVSFFRKEATVLHTTLYRKWRPTDFSSVIGQKHITDVLRYEVQNGKTTHAYLFCGSRGTGKTTCAKILSMAVNCEHPVDGNPCMECETCRNIDQGATLDVVEIDAALLLKAETPPI